MKIIDAHWEKRNLGVDCTEINVNYSDSITELTEVIRNLDSKYQVLRIPTGRTDVLLSVQRYGFQVIELNFKLVMKTDNYSLPMIYKRFEPFINIKQANEEEIQYVLSEIKEGELFQSDKISKDPCFSTEKSGDRYYYWSKDVLNKGAHLCMGQYNGENVAFGLNYSEDGNTYNAFLGGVFQKHSNRGLGFVSIHTNIVSIISQGGSRIVTGVSSNNNPILRLHMLFGFSIQEMNYVLIKHK